MTKPIVVFRNFAAAFKFLYTCSDDHLHGQKRERERETALCSLCHDARQRFRFVQKKKIVPFSSNNYFCSSEYSSFSK